MIIIGVVVIIVIIIINYVAEELINISKGHNFPNHTQQICSAQHTSYGVLSTTCRRDRIG